MKTLKALYEEYEVFCSELEVMKAKQHDLTMEINRRVHDAYMDGEPIELIADHLGLTRRQTRARIDRWRKKAFGQEKKYESSDKSNLESFVKSRGYRNEY